MSLSNQRLLLALQDKLLKQTDPAKHLLIGFLTHVVTVYHHLLPLTDDCISSEFLQEQVFQDIISLLQPMVLRTLVLEMHLANSNGLLNRKSSKARFEQYVSLLKKPEFLQQILDKYPQLAILVSQRILFYKNNVDELLSRLKSDFDELSQLFCPPNASLKQLTHIQMAGDQHRQGRAVAILFFQEGINIIYKPRPLEIDLAFQNLLLWFNQLTTHPLKTIKILKRPAYGWCEYIQYDECRTEHDISQYYFRFGILLAICHLVRAHDLHFENLIACGNSPVLVDYECILKPMLNTRTSCCPNFYITQTTLLPSRLLHHQHHGGVEVSALAAAMPEESVYKKMSWEHAGTDQMKLIRKTSTLPIQKNLPKLNGNRIPYHDYQQDIINGFKHAYTILLAERHYLLTDASPLIAFKQAHIRFIIRPTNEYAKLLEESYHPKLLADEQQRRNYFQWLTLRFQHQAQYNDFISSEQHDLLLGDIPSFDTRIASHEIYDSQSIKKSHSVSFSGWELLQFQVEKQLSTLDLHHQQRLLKLSFLADNYSKHANKPLTISQCSQNDLSSALLHLAKIQLDYLAKEAITDQDELTWPKITIIGMTNQAILDFTNWQLYHGISGIALTFAHAAEVFADTHYRMIAKKCYFKIASIINTLPLKSITSNTGAFQGASGLLYCLLHLYRLWNDDDIKTLILKLTAQLQPLIIEDKEIDIISGNAGCLGVLLQLQLEMNDHDFTPLMQACVDRILTIYPYPQQRPTIEKPQLESPPWLGFSHGTSGILWALAKFDAISPQEKLKTWITQALVYEKQQFDDTKENWPNPMSAIDNSWISMWCHGGAGIGMSRADLPAAWQTPAVKQDIQYAIKTTKAIGFNSNISLCHGCIGNTELLLQTEPVSVFKTHGKLLNSIVNHLQQETLFSDSLPLEATPGLMTGRAGIAYQLMRLYYPSQLPAVLLLK